MCRPRLPPLKYFDVKILEDRLRGDPVSRDVDVFAVAGAAPEVRQPLQSDYPPGAFTTGVLNGRRINCLSVHQQRDFHTGCQRQAKDTHDLAQQNTLDQP